MINSRILELLVFKVLESKHCIISVSWDNHVTFCPLAPAVIGLEGKCIVQVDICLHWANTSALWGSLLC